VNTWGEEGKTSFLGFQFVDDETKAKAWTVISIKTTGSRSLPGEVNGSGRGQQGDDQ